MTIMASDLGIKIPDFPNFEAGLAKTELDANCSVAASSTFAPRTSTASYAQSQAVAVEVVPSRAAAEAVPPQNENPAGEMSVADSTSSKDTDSLSVAAGNPELPENLTEVDIDDLVACQIEPADIGLDSMEDMSDIEFVQEEQRPASNQHSSACQPTSEAGPATTDPCEPPGIKVELKQEKADDGDPPPLLVKHKPEDRGDVTHVKIEPKPEPSLGEPGSFQLSFLNSIRNCDNLVPESNIEDDEAVKDTESDEASDAEAEEEEMKPCRVVVDKLELTKEQLDEINQSKEPEADDCGRYYSNDFSEQCLLKCWPCGREMTIQQLRKHLGIEHDMDLKSFRQKFHGLTYTRIVYHQCGECGDDIIMDYETMYQHFKFHGVNFTEYRSRYPKSGSSVSPRGRMKKVPSTLTTVSASPRPKRDIDPALYLPTTNTMDIKQEGFFRGMDSEDDPEARTPPRTKRKRAISPDSGLKKAKGWEPESDDEGIELKNYYKEMCKEFCKVCNADVVYMYDHVYRAHNMTLVEYREMHGEVVYTRLTYHRCKLCNRRLVFDYQEMKDHVKKHKMTFKDYKDRYLDPNSPSYIPEEMRETPNGNVDFSPTKPRSKPRLTYRLDTECSSRPRRKGKSCCKICNQVFPPYVFKKHILDDHNMSFHEYTNGLATETEENLPSEPEPEPDPVPEESSGDELATKVSNKKTPKFLNRADSSQRGKVGFGKYNYTASNGKVYSDVLAEQCTFRCQICDGEMTRKRLAKHVFKFHNQKFVDYKNTFGDWNPIKKVFYRCKVCDAELLFTYETILDHVRTKHNLNFPEYKLLYAGFSDAVEEQKFITNDLEKMCTCICEFCNEVFYHHQYGRHLYSQHFGSRVKEYKYLNKAFYRCALCPSVLLFSRSTIKDHVARIHKQKLIEYAALPGAFEGDPSLLFSSRDFENPEAPNLEEMDFKDELESHGEDLNHLLDDLDEEDDFGLDPMEEDLGPEEAEAAADENVPDPEWFLGNTFTCLICMFSSKNKDHFKEHVHLEHKIPFSDFGTQYTATDNFYECRICNVEVYHDRDYIQQHLTEAHHTDLHAYAEEYVKKQESSSSDQTVNTEDDPGREANEDDNDTKNHKETTKLRRPEGSSDSEIELNPDTFLGERSGQVNDPELVESEVCFTSELNESGEEINFKSEFRSDFSNGCDRTGHTNRPLIKLGGPGEQIKVKNKPKFLSRGPSACHSRLQEEGEEEVAKKKRGRKPNFVNLVKVEEEEEEEEEPGFRFDPAFKAHMNMEDRPKRQRKIKSYADMATLDEIGDDPDEKPFKPRVVEDPFWRPTPTYWRQQSIPVVVPPRVEERPVVRTSSQPEPYVTRYTQYIPGLETPGVRPLGTAAPHPPSTSAGPGSSSMLKCFITENQASVNESKEENITSVDQETLVPSVKKEIGDQIEATKIPINGTNHAVASETAGESGLMDTIVKSENNPVSSEEYSTPVMKEKPGQADRVVKDEPSTVSNNSLQIEDDFLYLCPYVLEGCRTITTLKGLQEGPAAVHCMQAHSAAPFKLNLRKKFWKKVERSCTDLSTFKLIST